MFYSDIKEFEKDFSVLPMLFAAVFGTNTVKLHRFFIPRFPSCNDHLKKNYQKKTFPDTSVRLFCLFTFTKC